jgi:exodeoxyribonuclease-1
MNTFYWYDFETTGISPRVDRITQFAGIRTDENLNIIDEHMLYCKPTHDCLPSPYAVAVTGITPQYCEKNGLIEHEFLKKIHAQFSQANTCIVGYNSIRFDDEFSRYGFFRNFIEPYAWHWQNNNTRWDILDVVRLAYALKKDSSLNWVFDKNDKPSFKLDRLSIANGIEHSDAHDALADVRATIALAKIIKDKQPQLFDYAFSLKDKKVVAKKIELFAPMLHTSGMYSANLSCTRLATALAYHPEYADRAIVFNLDQDPSILLDLNTEELKKLLFTKKDDLPEGVERLQLKELIFNKSPMFVPNVHKLEAKIIEQLQIDMNQCFKNLDFIQNNQSKIQETVRAIYLSDGEKQLSKDADQALYDKFVDNADRKICNQIQTLSPDEIGTFQPSFKDKNLSTLFLHFKGRNYPQLLSDSESEDWFEIVQSRVQDGENGYLSFDDFELQLAQLIKDAPEKQTLWKQLETYAQTFL